MDSSQFHKKLLGMQESMMHVALKLTANMEDARDLFQETMLKLLDSKDKFVENTNIKGWFYIAMLRIFINDYHKKLRIKAYIDQSEDVYNLDMENNSGMDSPESDSDKKEIKAAIDSLNEVFKRPFLLYEKGFKYYEIAIILEIPIGTVKKHIHEARRILQEKLKDFR